MNTSTKDEALTKIEVLKVLLPEPHKSIYALWDILKEKYGGKKANYPTLHRRIKEKNLEKKPRKM